MTSRTWTSLYPLRFLDSHAPPANPSDGRSGLPQTDGIFIRVITAKIAHEHQSRDSIPILFGGKRIPLSITLRKLKGDIAKSLGLSPAVPRISEWNPICNCAFAEKVASSGLWSMLRCREHMGPTCRLPHEGINKKQQCAMCWIDVANECETCRTEQKPSECPLVVNAGCGHVFHYHCYTSWDYSWTNSKCPAGCGKTREMAPISPHGRLLILVHGRSILETIHLDREFGGREALAVVPITVLRDTIANLIQGNLKNSCLKVINGSLEGNNIKFYHSLVVSICDYIQHSSEGPRTLPFSEDTSEVTIQLDKETFPINPPEPDETQTLDLHTKTALIATNNLNITLQELGFREEAIDDCVDIYAVAREVETFREEDGMFSVYRYKKCWNIPSPNTQTQKGYACFLSCLNVFAGLFDQRRTSPLGKAEQNVLLRRLTECLRFPPAVRCMYILINQRKPLPEDRAALIQALLLHGESSHNLAIKDFNLEHSQSLFRALYNEIMEGGALPSSSADPFPFVEQFETTALTCYLSGMTIQSGVCLVKGNEEVLVEKKMKEYYVGSSGLLRNTMFSGYTENPTLERVSTMCGGRLGSITYSKCLPDLPKVVRSIPSFLRGYWNPLAVIAPKDLKSAIPPALTRDALGNLCVYTGRPACGLDASLFNPLTGEREVDTEVVTEALARLRESDPIHNTYEFSNFDGTRGADGRPPTEVIMVCLDTSSSMDTRDFVSSRGLQGSASLNMTRLEIVKQLFQVFVDRTLAYNYPHQIGLVTFDTLAQEVLPITHVTRDFRTAVANMKPTGMTSLWDALHLAHQKLEEKARTFPNAVKRIVVLTDGEDTGSKIWSPAVACGFLQRSGIKVDSLVVGNAKNLDIRTISFGTGGYKFAPNNVDSAVAICELESFLATSERPIMNQGALGHSFDRLKLQTTNDTCDPRGGVYPKGKEHPNSRDTFMALEGATIKAQKQNNSNRPSARDRPSRLIGEMRYAIQNKHPFYDIYISETNIGFWKVVMEAPTGCDYSGGTFLIYIDMDENYPNFAPKARFITPILHPNVTKQGRICHSILDRKSTGDFVSRLGNWTTDTWTVTVLNLIWALLLTPDMEDPVNVMLTELQYTESGSLRDAIRNHVRRHATKTRSSWASELGAQ